MDENVVVRGRFRIVRFASIDNKNKLFRERIDSDTRKISSLFDFCLSFRIRFYFEMRNFIEILSKFTKALFEFFDFS